LPRGAISCSVASPIVLLATAPHERLEVTHTEPAGGHEKRGRPISQSSAIAAADLRGDTLDGPIQRFATDRSMPPAACPRSTTRDHLSRRRGLSEIEAVDD